MNRTLIFPLFLIFFAYDAFAQNNGETDYALDIKIPSTWIERVQKYDYKQNNAAVLKEFERIIKPHVIYVPDYAVDSKGKSGYLNAIFADLDGETGKELICTMAWDINSPSMAVFKKMNDGWHLLYMEDYYMFYTDPEMHVANSSSKNKTFYFRTVYNRGSGTYSDGYKFFKLIGNKVFSCLETIHESRISGWGLYINYDISSTLIVGHFKDDCVMMSYKYSFDGAADGGGENYVNLIKGSGVATYKWSDNSKNYILDIPAYNNRKVLTVAQIKCFEYLSDDQLFIRAFQKQIDNKLSTGTTQQKKILKRYLEKAKKQKMVMADN